MYNSPHTWHVAVFFCAVLGRSATDFFPNTSPLFAPFIMDVDNSSNVPTTDIYSFVASGSAVNVYGWAGLMPRINDDGSIVNGGVPQMGNLTAHVVKLRADMSRVVPVSFRGALVLDWEFWRAEWNRTLPRYRNLSIYLSGGDELAARRAYENGARVFLEASLATALALFPDAAAGIYAYPINDWSGGGYSGSAADTMRSLNDDLLWLWSASRALFPSIYLTSPNVSKYDGQSSDLYVRTTVDEAVRCASRVAAAARPLVLPMIGYVYDMFPRPMGAWTLLVDPDVAIVASAPADAGADGVLLWGAVGSPPFETADFVSFLNLTLGPALIASADSQRACAYSRCGGHSRCTPSGCAFLPPAPPTVEGLSPAASAGIAVGIVATAAVVAALRSRVHYTRRRRSRRNLSQRRGGVAAWRAAEMNVGATFTVNAAAAAGRSRFEGFVYV